MTHSYVRISREAERGREGKARERTGKRQGEMKWEEREERVKGETQKQKDASKSGERGRGMGFGITWENIGFSFSDRQPINFEGMQRVITVIDIYGT